MSDRPGFYRGMPAFFWVDEVKDHRRAGRLAEAEEILVGVIPSLEGESRQRGTCIPTWPYEILAQLLRKQGRVDDERRLLERFVAQRLATDSRTIALVDRLQVMLEAGQRAG